MEKKKKRFGREKGFKYPSSSCTSAISRSFSFTFLPGRVTWEGVTRRKEQEVKFGDVIRQTEETAGLVRPVRMRGM